MREPLRDIVAMCVNDTTAAISRYTSRSRLCVSDVESFIYRQTISHLERILEKQSTNLEILFGTLTEFITNRFQQIQRRSSLFFPEDEDSRFEKGPIK